MNEKRWFPLESNPDVMNKYISGLGFPTDVYKFCDVLSLDDWALDMVPKPVVAVLMLFPIKESSEKHRNEEATRIEAAGQVVSENVVYMKQYVGNACGTIGLLHAISNAGLDSDIFKKDSYLSDFLSKIKGLNAEEIGGLLESDDAIETAHVHAASEGDTEAETMDVNSHFICFSHIDGHLYELDGRKEFPINHGATTTESLLSDTTKVARQFMERDPGEMGFTLVALTAVQQ